MPEHEPGPTESLAALHALVPAAEAEDCFEQAERAHIDAVENAWRREFERMEQIGSGPPESWGEQPPDGQLPDEEPPPTLGQVRGLLEYYLGARLLDEPEG